MKLGFFTAPYANQSLADTIKLLRSKYDSDTLEALELGTGNYPPNSHCDPDIYLGNGGIQRELRSILSDNGFDLSALSCHGNPVHPLGKIAMTHHIIQDKTIKLAGEMNVKTVVTFSGLQGDGYSITPIWVTSPWPDEQRDLYVSQLKGQAVYWDEVTREADKADVNLAIELHPNMFMHNYRTFRDVKEAVAELQKNKDGSTTYRRLKANPDLSHFLWRGVLPEVLLPALGEDIAYLHAKDTLPNLQFIQLNGTADATPLSQTGDRVSDFVYCGAGAVNWAKALRAARNAGYDGYVSIEHEDGQRDAAESLDMAIKHLNPIIPRKKAGAMTWAGR